MKKIIITTAIILGLGLISFADPNGGGMFGRGENSEQQMGGRLGGAPALPGHGHNNNQPAPLGSGIVLLTALGVAYGVAKRNHSKD